MRILFTAVFLLFQLSASAAPMESYEFESEAQEKTFQNLSEELRCLVCQNQSIAESNADLANDLRAEIHKLLLAGNNEAEIKAFMVDRYGDYVLYDPPFKPLTWLLWIGPVVIFLIGLFYARGFIARQNSSASPAELSDEENERLKELQSELNVSERDVNAESSDTKRGKRS